MRSLVPPRRGAALAAAALLGGGLAAAGCKGVLDVNNPNNVVEDAINSVAAAAPLASGVQGITVRAVNAAIDTYGTASDEMDFVGSQDGFFQLDVGNVSTSTLQFSDQSFQRLAEARWMGDQAIARFNGWEANGTLTATNLADRATTYLYTAVTYATIGDMFDDFALSDRQTAAAPIGEANMKVVYDSAVADLDRGLTAATAAGNATLRLQILATRARAKYMRALWDKVNPPTLITGAPAPVANPLVNDAGANADAAAALAVGGATDWTFSQTPSSTGTAGNNWGNDLNVRREMRIGQAYAQPDPTAGGQNRTLVTNGQPVITLNDPVTGQPDLALRARVASIINGGQFLPIVFTSAREMQLILAEAALASGNAADAQARINAVRAFTAGVPAWNGSAPDGLTMLRHMRRVNLFMYGRRLSDMARFGDRDPRWQTNSVLYRIRGCFFPITYTERQSRPLDAQIPNPVCSGL